MRTKKITPRPDASFYVPIYGGLVTMYKSPKALRQALKGIKIKDSKADEELNGICAYVENEEGSVWYLVGWYTGLPSTLVHESGHLAQFILQRAGIDPTDSKGETFCYLQEELVRIMGIDKKPRAKSAR